MSTLIPESVGVEAWLADWAAVSHTPIKTQKIVGAEKRDLFKMVS